ncbi:CDP-alcohol phosphatidyltransferase family protein [Microbispora bryophytorum]|uniref:CDP-alcohol phosphatidyltransferase family protein n=1 Tax=Microbispora bryophytorum subsp. camponoti TaxID=1677852 RepID=A0ABR8L4T2_9ACTN|nr:CDP-alcohol phosphatidyltransferase family protein [Microbispora camponoti]MBD3144520.1 CDP-alcohol phosphatidyltransferase family protein [Microbispora camponoti]
MTAPRQAASGTSPTDRDTAPAILYYIRDPANICTVIGLSLAVVALYLLLHERIHWATVALLAAVACDLVDGQIARRTPGRTPDHGRIGVQLDSLVDIVTSAVVPGMLLLVMGGRQAVFLPGAILIAVAGVLRLSYFNVHSAGGDHFRGLPVYYNPLAVAGAVLLARWLGVYTVYATIIVLVVLNLSSLRVPKQRGIGLWCLFGATFALMAALIATN